MKSIVRVAVAQIFCLAGDRSGNFVRIEAAVKEAKKLGAEIVCFPEMAILGWVNPEAHSLAFSIPGEDTRRLQEITRTYGLSLSIGLGEKEGNHLYDSAILIGPQGDLLLKHRKINLLAELMTPPYTPGSGVGGSTDASWKSRHSDLCRLFSARTVVADEGAETRPDDHPLWLGKRVGWLAGAWT